MSEYLFTSESVTEGHPDKIADQISDGVLDAMLAQDPASRVACETLITTGQVMIAGEVTTAAQVDIPTVVRDTVAHIGYVNSKDGFDAHSCGVSVALDKQSPDIAQGVDTAYEKRAHGEEDRFDEQGAGDQGLMFGFACDETPELMPLPVTLAHKLVKQLADRRKDGTLPWLRPDSKSQVSVVYEDNRPVAISNVVISTQHSADVEHAAIEAFCINEVIKKVLPKELLTKDTLYLINPTGRFVVGGPQGDTGLTGRKIIVDTYGGYGRHGGGAFSGKDPSKVDRSAAYMGRYVAKNIVAAGLASRCEIQFAYAIGYPDPVSVFVNTFGTAREGLTDAAITTAVESVFSFKPADIVKQLKLLRPIYSKTTNYGHFGKSDPDLTWEATDKVKALQKAVK